VLRLDDDLTIRQAGADAHGAALGTIGMICIIAALVLYQPTLVLTLW